MDEHKAIIAIANSIRRDGTLITEEAIKQAAGLHKKLSVEKTEEGLALVWQGHISDEK